MFLLTRFRTLIIASVIGICIWLLIHKQAGESIVVRNNVFANCKKEFIRNNHGIIVHNSDNYLIEHNTFITMGVRRVLYKDDSGFPYSPDYKTVKNNIFYQTGEPANYFPKRSNGSAERSIYYFDQVIHMIYQIYKEIQYLLITAQEIFIYYLAAKLVMEVRVVPLLALSFASKE